jgi:hypothetical protein
MFCKYYQLLASRQADGDLMPKEKQRLSAHLARCGSCRRREQQFLALKRLLKKAEKRGGGERIALQKGKKPYWPLKMGLGVAAVLILGLVGFFVFVPLNGNPAAPIDLAGGDEIINYPLGSLLYYEEKPSSYYIENYYTPMSSFFLLSENK